MVFDVVAACRFPDMALSSRGLVRSASDMTAAP
jgi:hypothetical protein